MWRMPLGEELMEPALERANDRATQVRRELVAERREAVEAIRRSEHRMNRTDEIAHLGSWELDLVRNQLSWSDEVYRIFGLTPQEFGATYEAFLDRIHPQDRAAVDAAYTTSVLHRKASYEIEHRVI